MRANIAEGSDHLVPTEHEDIMIADPTGELTGGFQLGDVADFDKTGRGVGMREVVVAVVELWIVIFVRRR